MSTQEESFFEESKKKVEEYVQDRLLLLKIDVVEKTSRLAAAMFSGIIIALFAFFVLFFLSFMVAYLFGELINHLYWGFAIVSGIYIILILVIIFNRKRLIENYVIKMVIDIFFEKHNEEIKERTDVK